MRPRASPGLAALLLGLAALGPALPGHAGEWLLDAPGLRELAPADVADRPARFAFPPGERLVYGVSYLGIPAGTVAIEVARWVAVGERRFAHVAATARTNAFFSWIHPVDDRSEAWIDLDRVRIDRTATSTRHGVGHWEEEVRFDWNTHFLVATEDRMHRRPRRREVSIDFGPFVHDTMDLFYAVRAARLGPGFDATFPTYADRKVFGFRVEARASPPIRSAALGDSAALVLEPSTWLDGVPHAAGEGRVWVEAEGARVPLRLRGWFRTSGASFLLRGLGAELESYVPHAPGWGPPRLPSPVPRPPVPETEAGRSLWSPPPEVRAARERAGAAPYVRRSPLPGAEAP